SDLPTPHLCASHIRLPLAPTFDVLAHAGQEEEHQRIEFCTQRFTNVETGEAGRTAPADRFFFRRRGPGANDTVRAKVEYSPAYCVGQWLAVVRKKFRIKPRGGDDRQISEEYLSRCDRRLGWRSTSKITLPRVWVLESEQFSK